MAASAAAARRGGPRAAVRGPAELRRVRVPLGGAVRRRRGRRRGQRDLTAAAGGSRAGCRLPCSASAVRFHLSSAAAAPPCTGEGRQAATNWRACACGCVVSAPCRWRKLLRAGTPGAGLVGPPADSGDRGVAVPVRGLVVRPGAAQIVRQRQSAAAPLLFYFLGRCGQSNIRRCVARARTACGPLGSGLAQ